jgi:negative regulator of flagellin synthesis FlgM
MTERINNPGFRPADAAGTRRSEAAKPTRAESGGGGKATPTAPNPADTVSITPSGLLLGKLAEVVAATPVVNADRVSAIKDAVASGSYEIDDQQVADKMLRFERDVLA